MRGMQNLVAVALYCVRPCRMSQKLTRDKNGHQSEIISRKAQQPLTVEFDLLCH